MANRMDIEVRRCEDCPFANMEMEFCEHPVVIESGGRSFLTEQDDVPRWCPLREESVLVIYAGK